MRLTLHLEFFYLPVRGGHCACTIVGAAFFQDLELGNQGADFELVVPGEVKNSIT